MNEEVFHFGDWQISPRTNSVLNGVERRQMEPRAMDVLLALCRNPQAVVSSEVLLEQCWGSSVYGDNPVHKTITQLRRVLGDTAASPRYIETIRKRGYRTIAEVVHAPTEAAPAAWLDVSPFRGLQAFFERHAAIFFGRHDATMRLLRSVNTQIASGFALQIVLGPSGSGKTSLIRAGLLPAMMQTRPNDMVPRVVDAVTLDAGEIGEHTLFVALGSALLDWEIEGAAVFHGSSSSALGEQLQLDTEAVIATIQAVLRADGDGRTPRFALFVDRLEALFTLPHVTGKEREQFLLTLATLARSACVVVIAACRNDFYPQLAQYPLLMESKQSGGHFDLTPPSQAEIGQIIRLPALAAGLTFGIDADGNRHLDDMLSEATSRSPDALPLLQYTLQELYRMRSADNQLSFAAFVQLGGVEGAIGHRAEEVVGQLNEHQRAALPRVLSLVVTISPTDDAVTGRRAPWSALHSAAERELVTTLVETRLFVSELVGAEPGFGVAHEALLRRWPRVTEWIDRHRNALRIRARIAQLTKRWVDDGKPADLLLPQGKQLDEATALVAMPGFTLTDDERALIHASARRATVRERLRLGALGVIVSLALLAAGLGATALASKKTAQQRRIQAEDLMEVMLGDFADKLRPLGRLELLDGVSSKAMQYLVSSIDGDETSKTLIQRAKALQLIGEVRRERAQAAGAEAAFIAAHTTLLAQSKKTPNDVEMLKNLGSSAFWIGQSRLEQNDLDAAQIWFTKYSEYSDSRARLEPENVDAWIEQSYAHNSLGTLAQKRGALNTAAAQFLVSIDLKSRALAKQPKNRTLAAELADSLSWHASTLEALGQLDSATAGLRRERAMLTSLHQSQPTDALWTYRLAIALHRAAVLQRARGENEQALIDLRDAATLIGAIIGADPGNLGWQKSLAFLRLDIARLEAQAHPSSQDVLAFNAALAAAQSVAAAAPNNIEWNRIRESARTQLARALLNQHRQIEAAQAIDAAIVSLEDMLAKNSANRDTRIQLAQSLLVSATVHRATGDARGVAGLCERSMKLLQDQVAGSADYRVLDPWVRANYCVGRAAAVASQKARLDSMQYRDRDYLMTITTTPER